MSEKVDARGVIIIAEDDAGDRFLYESAIREAGCSDNVTVEFARSGVELLRLVNAHKELPLVVFLDINMPHFNGKQSLAHLRAIADPEQLPVVILSTSTAEQDIEDTYRLGANLYIQKPGSFAAVREIFCRYACDAPVSWPRATRAEYFVEHIAASALPGEIAPQREAWGGKEIILLEPEDHDVQIFRTTLQQLGLNIPTQVFTTGAAAYTYLDQSNAVPGLILCDVSLVRDAGTDLRLRLAANERLQKMAVPFILMMNDGEEWALKQLQQLPLQGVFIREKSLAGRVAQLELIIKYWSASVAP